MDECVFCGKFCAGSAYEDRSVFDRAIWENDEFVIVPSVGSLVPGYLLVIPRQHYISIAQLPFDMLGRLARIKLVVREILTQQFSPPLFFEHGPMCHANNAGSCIDHAHLHCVPLAADLLPVLRSHHSLRKIEGFEAIANQARLNESYVYFENQHQEQFLFSDGHIPSQYLRRLISDAMKIPDLWDWGIFTFEQNAVATVNALGAVPFTI